MAHPKLVVCTLGAPENCPSSCVGYASLARRVLSPKNDRTRTYILRSEFLTKESGSKFKYTPHDTNIQTYPTGFRTLLMPTRRLHACVIAQSSNRREKQTNSWPTAACVADGQRCTQQRRRGPSLKNVSTLATNRRDGVHHTVSPHERPPSLAFTPTNKTEKALCAT